MSKEDKDFITMYRGIEDRHNKRTLRKKIISACNVEAATFYSWIHRKRIPLPAREAICKILEKPHSILFPENEERRF